MKKILTVSIFTISLLLVGCGSKPMSEADMAKKYNFTLEEFQEQKQAAARMNMTLEEHLNMN